MKYFILIALFLFGISSLAGSFFSLVDNNPVLSFLFSQEEEKNSSETISRVWNKPKGIRQKERVNNSVGSKSNENKEERETYPTRSVASSSDDSEGPVLEIKPRNQRLPTGVAEKIEVEDSDFSSGSQGGSYPRQNEQVNKPVDFKKNEVLVNIKLQAGRDLAGELKDGTTFLIAEKNLNLPEYATTDKITENSVALLYFENLRLSCQYESDPNRGPYLFFSGCSNPNLSPGDSIPTSGNIFFGVEDSSSEEFSASISLKEVSRESEETQEETK